MFFFEWPKWWDQVGRFWPKIFWLVFGHICACKCYKMLIGHVPATKYQIFSNFGPNRRFLHKIRLFCSTFHLIWESFDFKYGQRVEISAEWWKKFFSAKKITISTWPPKIGQARNFYFRPHYSPLCFDSKFKKWLNLRKFWL